MFLKQLYSDNSHNIKNFTIFYNCINVLIICCIVKHKFANFLETFEMILTVKIAEVAFWCKVERTCSRSLFLITTLLAILETKQFQNWDIYFNILERRCEMLGLLKNCNREVISSLITPGRADSAKLKSCHHGGAEANSWLSSPPLHLPSWIRTVLTCWREWDKAGNNSNI